MTAGTWELDRTQADSELWSTGKTNVGRVLDIYSYTAYSWPTPGVAPRRRAVCDAALTRPTRSVAEPGGPRGGPTDRTATIGAESLSTLVYATTAYGGTAYRGRGLSLDNPLRNKAMNTHSHNAQSGASTERLPHNLLTNLNSDRCDTMDQ